MRKFYIYPLVISVYPVVSLILSNLGKVQVSSQLIGFIVCILGVIIVWALLRRLIPDVQKANLATLLVGGLFFTYGYLTRAISLILIGLYGNEFDNVERFGRLSDHPDVSGAIFWGWIIFLALTIFLILKTSANLQTAGLFFHYTAMGIIALALVNWGYAVLSERDTSAYISAWESQIQGKQSPSLSCPEKPPNIYYIIPDAYARADKLGTIYQYDNTPFIEFLVSQGFRVIENGQSNYAQTPLSLASSLNFTYLDEVVAQVGSASQNRGPLQEMILHSKIAELLRKCGYKTIAFSSGFTPTNLTTSDVFVSPPRNLDDFQNELLNLTPLPTISRLFSLVNQYQLHRDLISLTLDQLPVIGHDFNGPIFVFAHITAPHHPFVFDAQGNPVDSSRLFALSEDFRGAGQQEYIQGYTGQLAYINARLEQIIPQIIGMVPDSTVIILQSDHGPSASLNWDEPDEPGMQERMAILNAIYLPPELRDDIPVDLTPVNSFRLIMNAYFDTRMEILENHSYFSTLDQPYTFREISEPTQATQ